MAWDGAEPRGDEKGMKKTIIWSYERGSWQYDILCLLIVATIFLVPGRFFGDRGREGIVTGTINQSNSQMVEIDGDQLLQTLAVKGQSGIDFPEGALGFYLREQYNRPVRIIRCETLGGPTGAPGVSETGKVRYRVWFE